MLGTARWPGVEYLNIGVGGIRKGSGLVLKNDNVTLGDLGYSSLLNV
jgi:hypothetical protein